MPAHRPREGKSLKILPQVRLEQWWGGVSSLAESLGVHMSGGILPLLALLRCLAVCCSGHQGPAGLQVR